jgi:hypothetical protein
MLMTKWQKWSLFLTTLLVVLVSGYGILAVLNRANQTPITSIQVNPTPTGGQLSPIATRSSQTASVQYWVSPVDLQKYIHLNYQLREFVEVKEDSKARLLIDVIYAIDKNKVFLGGSLSFSNRGDAQRSVLLRSLDGGKQWTEVMPTTIVSEVEHIIFLSQGMGWALVQGAGELGSGMPTMLWHTTNFGETWEIAGRIQGGSSYSGRYTTLKFYNSTHGEISFICDSLGLCQGGNHYSIISTQDGGVSWQESYHLALPLVEDDPFNEKRLSAFILPKRAAYGSRVGNCWYTSIQECPSYGQDGSEWQAEYSIDRLQLLIRRRLPLENEWTTYTLPVCIEYKQGKIMEVCKDSH